MEQRLRIQRMEQVLNQSDLVIKNLKAALQEYEAIQPSINELKEYYQSDLWLKDYDDDRSGKFPADLKRGILSEDAIDTLLLDHYELLQIMKKLSQ